MKLLLAFAFILTIGSLQAHPGHGDHDQDSTSSTTQQEGAHDDDEDTKKVDPTEEVENEELKGRVEAPN